MLQTVQSERSCRVCGKGFLPFRSTQAVCGAVCARKMGPIARKAAKDDRRFIRARLDELKPLAYWVKQAQAAVNAWIKARDAALPCISCGEDKPSDAWKGGDGYHAGHFLTTAARPELRFDEANIHKQCIRCNVHLSGNIVRYRPALIQKIGQSRVDWLEGPHEPKRYRADDLKAITAEYRLRLKALKAISG